MSVYVHNENAQNKYFVRYMFLKTHKYTLILDTIHTLSTYGAFASPFTKTHLIHIVWK